MAGKKKIGSAIPLSRAHSLPAATRENKIRLALRRPFGDYFPKKFGMSQTTRDKILKTTFLLLLEKGYDRVLVSDIQDRLGISRGLMYRYFKGKSELFFEACRKYFYDKFFPELDYDKITLAEFFRNAEKAVGSMTNIDGEEVDILKYNTLYSAMIQCEPKFKREAQAEFDKARKVIRNAIKRGEIKKLPENFIGATILAIFGRTSYITQTPSNSYVCKRILEDIDQFYRLIRRK